MVTNASIDKEKLLDSLKCLETLCIRAGFHKKAKLCFSRLAAAKIITRSAFVMNTRAGYNGQVNQAIGE